MSALLTRLFGRQQGGDQQGGDQQDGDQPAGGQQEDNGQQNGGQQAPQNGGANQQPQQQQSLSSSTPFSQPHNSANKTSSTISIPLTAPAGFITITKPPQQSLSYFKLAPGELITFGWNFSDILVTPTHLTVSAICQNGNTYPVGPTNGVIPGNATSIVWDPYAYQTGNPSKPLAQATYALHIWGDGGPSAVQQPGVLTPNTALEFAFYTPQSYTPIANGELLPVVVV